MKRLFTQLVYLIVIVLLVACGRRTAPVPYEIPEVSLPGLKVQKPINRGDWLYLSWSLDTAEKDVSADLFVVQVFEQSENCRYCNTKPIDTIQIPTINTNLGDSLYFQNDGNKYGLYIKKTIHEKWFAKGLVYFELSYQTALGLRSAASEKAWPTPTNPIAIPEVSIIKTLVDKKTGGQNIIFRWKLVPERIYRSYSQNSIGREVTQNYGINLYSVKNKNNLFNASKVNKVPLLSGQATVHIQKSLLFACHVDQFGNESKKVLVLDNSSDSPMKNGKQ